MLVFLMLSHKFLRLFSLFFNFLILQIVYFLLSSYYVPLFFFFHLELAVVNFSFQMGKMSIYSSFIDLYLLIEVLYLWNHCYHMFL